MQRSLVSFSVLHALPVAHTDAGDFLMTPQGPQKEFFMAARITKVRAGLFFLVIEERSFTTHKNSRFAVGQNVVALVRPVIKDGELVNFVVSGLEAIA